MKTILFLGQAPAKPASKHEVPGTYLYAWLRTIHFSDETIARYCHFYALIDTFPGAAKKGHLLPTKEQVDAHRPILKQAIAKLQPDVIVPVGKMAITELTGQKPVSLEELVGTRFVINPFGSLEHPIACIPFSHPSGRSSWNHTHRDHVTNALGLLAKEARAE